MFQQLASNPTSSESKDSDAINLLQRENTELSKTLSTVQLQCTSMATTLSRLQADYSNLQMHTSNLVFNTLLKLFIPCRSRNELNYPLN